MLEVYCKLTVDFIVKLRWISLNYTALRKYKINLFELI